MTSIIKQSIDKFMDVCNGEVCRGAGRSWMMKSIHNLNIFYHRVNIYSERNECMENGSRSSSSWGKICYNSPSCHRDGCWNVSFIYIFFLRNEEKSWKTLVCVLSTSLPSVFCIIISLPAEVDNYRPSMSDYSCHVICSMVLNEILRDPDVLTPPYIS